MYILGCIFSKNLTPGVDVGSWTSFLHGIRGTVSFPNPTTVQLDNFFYDGGGLSKCVN